MSKTIKGSIAEFIGVFALCFVGILAIFHFSSVSGGLLGIALAHGLTIAVMVAATMAISGGQLNPAVSIALLVIGKQDAKTTVFYVVAQCLGGLVAALVIQGIGLGSIIGGGTPAPGLPIALEGGAQLVMTPFRVIVVEMVLTFFLVFVIYGAAVIRSGPYLAGLFIGLTVALDILAGGPLTGAAMNPARQLGPALLAGGEHLGNIWMYWVGPVAGAIVAAFVGKAVLEPEQAVPE